MNNTLNITLISVSAVFAMVCEWNSWLPWFALGKLLTTVLIMLLLHRNTAGAYSKYEGLVLFGLVFCLMGDAFLLNDGYFIYGLSAFLIGHIMFIVAFSSLTGFSFHPTSLLAMGVISASAFSILAPHLGQMMPAVLCYMIVITTMAWQAIALFLANKTRFSALIAAGACLFMFSDFMIALNKFVMPFEFASLVILSSYWLAIGLIAYSAHLEPKLSAVN